MAVPPGSAGYTVANWLLYGVFPDPPQRATPVQPVTFRVNAQRWGHRFTVWQSDGYAHRFLDYANATGAVGGYTAETIADWNDQGLYNPLEVLTFTANLDPTRVWWLTDDSEWSQGYPAIPAQQADVFDGWVPRHGAPPDSTVISIRLPFSRFLSPFRLACPFGEEIWHTDSMSRSAEAETIAGLDRMADYQVSSFWITLPNPTPYVSEGFLLQDMADGSNPTSHSIRAGENDLRTWYAPPQALSLTISSSRWEHELLIRHPEGTAFPVIKDQTQAYWNSFVEGNAWPTSYYYYYATANHRPELPWYVEDASTGERIGPNPSDADLIMWIFTVPPRNVVPTEQPGGTFLLSWTFAETYPEGAFRIERRESDSEPWLPIDTFAAADTFDPWTQTACARTALAASQTGKTAKIRVIYEYGGRRSVPSNTVGLQRNMDTDSDGMADWWERHYFGSLNMPGGAAADSWAHDEVSNLEKFQQGLDPTAFTGTTQTETPGGSVVNLQVFTRLEL